MHSKWIVVLASFVVGCNSNKDVSSTGGKPASSVTSELAPTAAAIQVDLGALADKTLITGIGGDATDKGGKLTPKNGEYTDLGVYCAGLQAGYTLKTGGDTLVALEIWNDEESGPGKNSKVVAKLPPSAQIVMK